ncbi:MAG: hypothetical protein JWR51_3468 [Devosia sp.]|uniref:hypothetical protein n=1 Tax=Devosia sp. TaxID=1871048 RepID=UPI00261A05E2|nr:hypothetical protein [Devosia sp.]MDB5530365.1 hypothetical protein [Devosia sp.]
MAQTSGPPKAINPVALQLLVLACHGATMALAFGLFIVITLMDLHGRGVVYVAMMALFAPATLSGYVCRRLSLRMPSSGFTWWMAFLFTLSTAGIAMGIGAYGGMPSRPLGMDRMQTGGLILGVGSISILASAVLFRLGASTHKTDRDIIKRMLTRTRGRDAS